MVRVTKSFYDKQMRGEDPHAEKRRKRLLDGENGTNEESDGST